MIIVLAFTFLLVVALFLLNHRKTNAYVKALKKQHLTEKTKLETELATALTTIETLSLYKGIADADEKAQGIIQAAKAQAERLLSDVSDDAARITALALAEINAAKKEAAAIRAESNK